MKYSFPQPVNVPYEIKQKVMNHVFPKKGSLIKRSLLVKVVSWYSLFLWVVILFSFLYLHFKQVLPVSQSDIQISVQQNLVSDVLVSSQEINDIEKTLQETESLLAEIDALI